MMKYRFYFLLALAMLVISLATGRQSLGQDLTDDEAEPEFVIKAYDTTGIMRFWPRNFPARKMSDIGGDDDTIFPNRHTSSVKRFKSEGGTKRRYRDGGGSGMMCQFGGGGGMDDNIMGGGGGWGGGGGCSGGDFLGPIGEIITTLIEPDSWDRVGGSGSIDQCGYTIVVSQTEAVHAKIGELLKMLKETTARGKNVTVEVDIVELPRDQIELLIESDNEQTPAKIFGLVKSEQWKTVDPIYSSTLTGRDRQTVSTVSGGQRKTCTTIAPVVGQWSDDSAESAQDNPVEPRQRTETTTMPDTISASSVILAQTFASSDSVPFRPFFKVIQTGWAVETTPVALGVGTAALLDVRIRRIEEAVSPEKVDPRKYVDYLYPIPLEKPKLENWQFATTRRVPVGKRVLVGGMDSLYVFVKVTVN